MSTRYQELQIGDRIDIGGVIVELVKKTGRRARLRIDTDAPIIYHPAHECQKEVTSYGTNHRRLE